MDLFETLGKHIGFPTAYFIKDILSYLIGLFILYLVIAIGSGLLVVYLRGLVN